ncbi:N-acetylglucosamine kinase [Rhizohabitans arisaemae]|uniref:N-acetylglucosamine kinase n=1 Tax=Rhizohabitans arisaemae TaxID=2720610 RepID=UPI0024B16220|nr:BadF/BadG/BcrA/BcrD ATPase family protein [Rhizohabitans arisaemae]
MTRRTILAVDGGNSKTDVLLLTEDGEVLATARGPAFIPQSAGVEAAIDVVADAVREIFADSPVPPAVDHVAAYVAGADLPSEEEALQAELMRRGFATEAEVGNDTLALLRAGASADWGVAVVCGAGINCLGRGPDGATARFPALGRISGDFGGGYGIGEEALWQAARAEDGRGPATALVEAVCALFGKGSVQDVSIAVHTGEIPAARLHELTPVLLAVAEAGDPVARSVRDRLADEVTVLGTVALGRLGLLGSPCEVVLGGGVLAAREPGLMSAIEQRYAVRAPQAKLVVADLPPVVGAALLGLDRLDAPQSAKDRLRAGFTPR